MGRFLWRKAGNINTAFLGKISTRVEFSCRYFSLNIGASQPNSIDFEIISLSPVAPGRIELLGSSVAFSLFLPAPTNQTSSLILLESDTGFVDFRADLLLSLLTWEDY